MSAINTLTDFLTQAETQLLTVQAQLIDVGISRAQNEHAIAILVGRPPSAFGLQEDERALTIPQVPVGLPSELLLRRPDVRSGRPDSATPARPAILGGAGGRCRR